MLATEPLKTEARVCGSGRCVPDHPVHCCHTVVTWRRPLGRGRLSSDELGYRCVSCKKESKTRTAIAVDRYGNMVVPDEDGP